MKKVIVIILITLLSTSSFADIRLLVHLKKGYKAVDEDPDGTEIVERGSFRIFPETHIFGKKETKPDYIIIDVTGVTFETAQSYEIYKIKPAVMDSLYSLWQEGVIVLEPDIYIERNGDTTYFNRKITISKSKIVNYVSAKRYSE